MNPVPAFEPRAREKLNGHAEKGLTSVSSVTSGWPVLPPAALHGLAGDAVRLIEPATESDPAAILGQTLAYFSNAIGRNAHIVVEGAPTYLNEFFVVSGSTGKGRKGTSKRRTLSLFEKADPSWREHCFVSGLSSGEGVIFAVRDQSAEDDGAPDRRLMVNEDEFATVLKVIGREGNTLSPVIRQAWDSGTLQVLTKNSPLRASASHISISAHCTIEELRRMVGATEIANGFCNRFIYLVAQRSKVLPMGGTLNPTHLEKLQQRFAEAIDFGQTPRELRLDDEAMDLWFEVYEELSEGQPGLVGAVLSRSEAHVLRLACLYAVLDSSSYVKVPHLKAALALWEYAEASARYIFGTSIGDPLADEVLGLIERHPEGLSRWQLHELVGKHVKSEQLGRALSVLRETRRIKPTEKRTNGRPAEVWMPEVSEEREERS